jgi:hypothetical protein
VRNYWSGSEAVERYFLFFSISRLADPNDDGVCPSEWEWPVRVTIIFLVFLWGIGLNHTYYLFIHTNLPSLPVGTFQSEVTASY